MTWNEAIESANLINNFSPLMPKWARDQYRAWQAEVWFNDFHHINEDHTENLRNAKHRLVRIYVEQQLEMIK